MTNFEFTQLGGQTRMQSYFQPNTVKNKKIYSSFIWDN